jgi:integrase
VPKKTLTARKVESKLRPGRRDDGRAKNREDYHDAVVPGLALRVTDRGHKSFVLVTRYPLNPKNPTRRSLGDVGKITLEQARQKARNWLELIEKGIDPRVDEGRRRAAEARRQVNTFAAVATEFLERHVKGPAYLELERLATDLAAREKMLGKEKALGKICTDPKNHELLARSKVEGIAKKGEAERIINSEFVNRWGPRPITEIMPEEVAIAIRAIVKRGAPYQAHNAFGYLRKLFNWAIGTGEYGIDSSPLERLQPAELIGKRQARVRTLSDTELRAVWEAGERMGYPYGPVFRLLILTGQREREAAEMGWSEVDFDKRLWTIAAERMKGDRAHEVPLAPAAVALLEAQPRWKGGFAFTTTGGTKPINGFSKAKIRIDKLSGVSGWKIHDLRRTMRTHLSALPVEDLVRELVIAHTKPGLHKVYDQHSFQDEKRRCLELWEARLLAIVEPRPGDVTDIGKARERRYAKV